VQSRAALHEEGLADDDLAAEHRRFVRDGDGVADRDRDGYAPATSVPESG